MKVPNFIRAWARITWKNFTDLQQQAIRDEIARRDALRHGERLEERVKKNVAND